MSGLGMFAFMSSVPSAYDQSADTAAQRKTIFNRPGVAGAVL